MASEAFQLALLLTLKDSASGGLDRFEAKLQAAGKAGKAFSAELDQIRSDLNRDLTIGGIGLAGLKMLKDGVQVAADYQSVMMDLRSTLATTGKDGNVNINKLAEDMMASEAVAVRLGNKLPGTTADFAQMMQVLKQNGLDTTTIVNGAADAVGNLAVASNAMPKEIAADFARFGNLFKLRAEDFAPAADVFSRIYTSTGQTSGELVEAAKYFQGRAGQSLGIGGLTDAKEYVRLFGLLGKQGMTGSMAGMGLTNFFTEYNTHRDKLQDLSKETGIKLDFFDKKGKFVGLDSVFEQMSQFDKLSAKDRTAWMEKIFGTLGSGVGNILVNKDAWKQFNAEQEKTVSLTAQTEMKATTFNNQMEALGGTLTNLKVAIFEPMLPGLTSAVEKGNELVGVIQLFTKSHPDVAKYAVSLLAMGSAAMVAYSGVKILTGGFRLLQLANKFSKADGIIGLANGTTTATASAKRGVDSFAGSVTSAGSKVGGLKKDLFSLNNVFKAVLVLEAIGFTWDQITEFRKTAKEWDNLNKGSDNTAQQSYTAYRGMPANQQDPKAEARSAYNMLQMGNQEMSKALDPSKRTWTDTAANIAKGMSGRSFEVPFYDYAPPKDDRKFAIKDQHRAQYMREDEEMRRQGILTPYQRGTSMFSSPTDRANKELLGAQYFQQKAPSLADPKVMKSFRQDVMPTMNLNDEMKQHMEKMLQMAFPDSFAQSMTTNIQAATDGITQSLSSLQEPITGAATLFSGLPQPLTDTGTAFATLPQPINDTTGALGNLLVPAGRIPGSFNNVFTSANQLSLGLDGVSAKISNFQMPTVASPTVNVAGSVAAPSSRPAPTIPSMFGMPGRAIGGVVERDGMAYVHAGNVITPAKATKGLPGFNQLMSLARSPRQAAIARPDASTYSEILRTFSDSSNTNSSEILKMIRERESVRSNSFPLPPGRSGNAATQTLADTKMFNVSLSVASPPSASQSATQTNSAGRIDLPYRSNAGDVRRDGNTRSYFENVSRRRDETNAVNSFRHSSVSNRENSIENRRDQSSIFQSGSSSRSDVNTFSSFINSVASQRSQTDRKSFDTSSERSSVSSFVNSLTSSRENRVDSRSDRRNSVTDASSIFQRFSDRKSESSRFQFSEELLREADRGGQRLAANGSTAGSGNASFVLNAPITVTIQGNAGPDVQKQIQQALGEHTKGIERLLADAMNPKRLDRKIGRSMDNGRLRA